MELQIDLDIHHQVIIAGAGPTGLMLACELKIKGIDVAVIERRAHGTTGESRAPGINATTMEIFKMRGLAEQFKAIGKALPAVLFSGIPMEPKIFDPMWPDALILPQHHTERLLKEHAQDLGVTFYWSTEVVSLQQNANGVKVLVKSHEQIHTIETAYLCGCDGGHSAVRKLSGVRFDGDDPLSHWIVADAILDHPPGGRGAFGRNTKIGTYQVSSVEPGWYRVNLMKMYPPQDRSAAVTLEELRETMIQGIGTDYGLSSARWISRYSDGFRQVENYRIGRIFLAGDAAHTHSPIGGQGLNLGVQDAVNLGWKLAAVIQGQANDSLLDTYHKERHPVAANALQLAKAQTALIKPGTQIQALRDVLAPIISMTEVTLHFASKLSGLGLCYDLGERTHPLLCVRMPDVRFSLEGEFKHLSEFQHKGDFLFVTFPGSDLELPDELKHQIKIIHVESLEPLYTTKGSWNLPVIGQVPPVNSILIRPDGFVAWVNPADAALQPTKWVNDVLSEYFI